MDEDKEFQEAIKERFAQLPKVVREAITSADISKRLRELADTHKLHIDQWESLENEVQMTLLGIQPSDELAANIKKEVGVRDEVAESLAADISRVVFEPIRQELERQLEHPDAVAATTTGVEDMRTQILADESSVAATPTITPVTPTSIIPATPAPTPVIPATPPPPPPIEKVERAPTSPSYAPAVPSHERKTIDGDPYREQLL